MQQSSDSIAVARLWLRLFCVTERTTRRCYAAFTYSWISGLPLGGIYAVTWLLLQGLYKLKLYWHCVVIRFCIYKYM